MMSDNNHVTGSVNIFYLCKQRYLLITVPASHQEHIEKPQYIYFK